MHLDVGLVRRIEVDAAEDLALVGCDDRVREGPAQLELLLVPAEIDEVVLE
jgi:hypothetical protein